MTTPLTDAVRELIVAHIPDSGTGTIHFRKNEYGELMPHHVAPVADRIMSKLAPILDAATDLYRQADRCAILQEQTDAFLAASSALLPPTDH